MLQQTQVTTVIEYYRRFMQRFPNVRCLAAAPLDEVLHLWSGLGYYSRARKLRLAAERIVAECAGELPTTLEALADLPGIGRSTAAAILDGNVRLVLSRVFGIEGLAGACDVAHALGAGRGVHTGVAGRRLYPGHHGLRRNALRPPRAPLRGLLRAG